jgi:hypothetical protein
MMRHGLRKAELGLPADQRKALIRALVTEVLRHGRITTTKVHFPPSFRGLSVLDTGLRLGVALWCTLGPRLDANPVGAFRCQVDAMLLLRTSHL